MAIDLDRKIGPLSLKMWGVVGAGTFGLVWYATRRGDFPADADDATDLGDVSDAFPAEAGGYFPMTGGGGGYDGIGYDPAATFVDLAPLEERIGTLEQQGIGISEQLGTIEALVTPTDVVAPGESPPIGAGQYVERLARLRARRATLKQQRLAAESSAQRKAIAQRVQRVQKTIKRVRAAKRAAKG